MKSNDEAIVFSMVTAVRTPDLELLVTKIDNTLRIEGLEQWILYHDGPASDDLKEYLASYPLNIEFFETEARRGKNFVLNAGVCCPINVGKNDDHQLCL